MPIGCVYCNGSHETAAEVRACWAEHEGREVQSVGEAGGEPDRHAATDRRDQTSTPRPSPLPSANPATRPAPRAPADDDLPRRLATARPGPDALGRNAIVDPGVAAPRPWSDAPRLLIDDEALRRPAECLVALRVAAHARQRVVIELATSFDTNPTAATELEPHQLGPRFSFEVDDLHHLVWSNSIDLRDPDAPTWRELDRAIHAGASSAHQSAPGGGHGDIVLANGQTVWLDGGPVRFTAPIDHVPVIHVTSVEHRTFGIPRSNHSNADLAPDQQNAVTHPGGPARIIAPAGSGKTRVLTERARHLLTEWQLPPGAVSLVAFNKRAQEEMRDRTADLPDLQVRTLNAISLAIINGTAPFEPQPTTWRTIDEPDVRRIIGELVTFPRRRNSDPVAPWIEALGLIRLGLVAPPAAEKRYEGDVDGLADVWPQYRAALERRRAVDFDDQIYRALLVLLTQPAARRAAQRANRIMLVDEFQDLTPAHLLLIRLLAAPGGAVFGVGDDDQTIYGYNGADPAQLIDFDELFPGSGSHPLEVNYRCPPDIVDAVDRLLRHNQRRVPKTIRAAPRGAGERDSPGGWSLSGGNDPVGQSVDAVEEALAAGASPNDIAVLTRVNALLAPVQVALTASGIPIAGGVGLEFQNRTAIRSALAWIRLATSGLGGPTRFNTEDVREALLRPSRSFHPRINDWISEQTSVGELQRLADRLNNEKDAARLLEFADDIERLRGLVSGNASTSDVVAALIDTIGLAGAVTTLDAHRRGMNRAAQGDDLTALRHLARLHDDVVSFGRWLGAQLAVRRSEDGVALATVHRVKGQEWPHVVVHLAEADQYPHRLAEDVEEERRLFHVAISRASHHATIVTGPSPSPFIEELTTEPSAQRRVSSHQSDVDRPRAAAVKTPKSGPADDLTPDQQARYESLCALRNELRDGKPAYVVFDNKTAAAIARAVPTSAAALLTVPGIGPAKVERYGDAILELLAGNAAS